MGARVGWPVVLGAALAGACIGALLTWATPAGSGVVSGAPPTPPGRGAHPARAHATSITTPTATPDDGGAFGRGRVDRTASPLQLDATYDFDIDVDYPAGSASVIERLRITNRGQAVDRLNLFVLPHLDADGFRELELQALQVDGQKPLPSWTENGANLVVPLPTTLLHGGTATVRMDFTLHAGEDVSSADAAALSKAHGLLQLLLWYPILSDGHGVVADGDPVASLPVSNVRYVIRSDRPVGVAVPGVLDTETPTEVRGHLEHARDFAFAVSPAFKTWSGRSGQTSVTVYARDGASPADRADGAAARDAVVATLDRIGAFLDQPYPASRFVLVGGTMDMESSGISFVHREYLSVPYKVAHETTHQWFPWLVGNDQQREPWLDEALTTFLAMGLHPRGAYCSHAPVDWSVFRFPSVTLELGWTDCDGYIQTVYWRGSAMFAAIDRSMGRAAFTAALREYIATFRFRVATGADLLEILRRHSSGKVDRVVRAWLSAPSLAGRGTEHGAGPLS